MSTLAKKRENKAQDKATKQQTKSASPPPEAQSEVDSAFPQAANFKVLCHNGHAYSSYLMWSDIKNNHNKFYIIQLH